MAIQKLDDEQIKLIYSEHITGISLEQLSKKYNVTRATLRKRMIKLNLKIFHFNSTSKAIRNCFDVLDSDKAYMLGFISADGSIVNNYICLEIHEKDIKVLELFRSLLCPSAKLTKSDNCYKCATYSTHIISSLNSFGIIQNKSKIDFSINLDELWYPDFIRGFIDGDGYVDKDMVKIYNTSFSLLTQIQKYLRRNNIKTSKVYKCSKKITQVYCLQIKHKDSLLNMSNLIWKDSCFCLQRKNLRQYRANFKDKRFKVV